MKRIATFLCLAFIACAVPLFFASCEKDDILNRDVPYTDDDLMGKWVEGTEYWRFDSNHTGRTWDTADDVQEDDELNTVYTWNLDGNTLTVVFTGDEVHQAVPRTYTIKSLSSSSLTWNDGISAHTFSRVD